MMAVVLIGLWGSMGGNRMLIFLAGLQGVPRELYEAAELDGAGTWNRFAHVTLPMISPTVLFNLILGVIGALQVFTIAFAGTGGGPSYATWFYALHIYRQAFEYFRMGYGSRAGLDLCRGRAVLHLAPDDRVRTAGSFTQEASETMAQLTATQARPSDVSRARGGWSARQRTSRVTSYLR